MMLDQRQRSKPISPLRNLIACGLCAVTVFSGQTAQAAEDPVEARKPAATRWVFPSDPNPVELFIPKRPATKADEIRRESLAWFMTGELLQRRNDFHGAYDAYKKAVKLNPKGVEIYRSLVPLAFSLNKTREAIQFATKAVELDPDDYLLARRLAIFMATQRKIPEALKLLETAVSSKKLEQYSAAHVTIQRDLAILYHAMGRKKEAADAYLVVFRARQAPKKYQLDEKTLERLEQSSVTSFERIGQVFLDDNRPQLAIQAFQAAQKDRKGKPGSLNYNLAKVYRQTKQPEKALKEIQKYLDAQLQTKGRAAYELLAEILKDLKKSDELIGRLEALAKKDRRNSELQYFLADQYVAVGRLKDAEELYVKTMGKSDDPAALLGLAAIYRKQGNGKKWLSALERGLRGAKDPDELEQNLQRVEEEVKQAVTNKPFTQSLIKEGRKKAADDKSKLTFEERLVLAKLAAESRDTEAAVQFYRLSLKARPAVASVLYGELGGYLLSAREYKQAAKVFQEAVDDATLRTSRPNFLFRLSQAYEMAGNTDAALKAIREAQEKLPGVSLLHYQEAWIYYHARKWDIAIKKFEQVIRDFPTNREIVKRCRFSLSNIYVQKGERRKGEAILEKVYEEDPDDISVNNDLGYLWAEAGKNLKQAEGMIRKAVKAEPNNAAYLDSLGWVLYMQKRYKEALPHLEKATKLPNGGDATIWDHLGDCYDKLGRKNDAVNAWKKSLNKARSDRFPDTKLIEKVKQKLGIATPEPVPAVKPH